MPNQNWRLWQYRDDANCFDFVRALLITQYNYPESAIPRFDILPTERLAMTREYKKLTGFFGLLDTPEPQAIACQFRGRVLAHVGLVRECGLIWHAGRAQGVRVDSVATFESLATRTEYRLWRSY